MITLAFYLFSFMVLFSGVMVVTARNPVHSVLFLIFAFFNSAGLFVILGAEFLAMLLVVVYVGAVAVLFLFVVMMMDINLRSLRQSFQGGEGDLFKTLYLTTGLLSVFALMGLFSVFGLSNIIGYFFQIVPQDTVKVSVAQLFSDPTTFFQLPLWDVMITLFIYKTFSYETLSFLIVLGLSLVIGMFVAELVMRRTFREVLQLLAKTIPVSWLLALLLGVELVAMIALWHDSSVTKELIGTSQLISEPDMPNTQALGQLIYTDYMYVFILSGMVLLVAMIGAIVLTLRTRPGQKRQNISDQIHRQKQDTLRLEDVPIGKGL